MLGTLDMRTALFMLHVLKKFKHALQQYSVTIDMKEKFDHILKLLSDLLFYMPSYYGERHLNGINFRENFMEYYKAAEKNRDLYEQFKANNFFEPRSLMETVERIVYTLLGIVDIRYQEHTAWLPPHINGLLQKVLAQPSIQLFPQLTRKQQERLIYQKK